MPGWAPTLELTCHVRRRPAPGWLKVTHTTRNLSGGMFEEDCEVWDAAGVLVAQARHRPPAEAGAMGQVVGAAILRGAPCSPPGVPTRRAGSPVAGSSPAARSSRGSAATRRWSARSARSSAAGSRSTAGCDGEAAIGDDPRPARRPGPAGRRRAAAPPSTTRCAGSGPTSSTTSTGSSPTGRSSPAAGAAGAARDEPARVFFDEDDARAVVARLLRDGFGRRLHASRFAGEDDDEDHPWAVVTDAPVVVLELLVEEYDGWLERADAAAPTTPAGPPTSPARPRRTSSDRR